MDGAAAIAAFDPGPAAAIPAVWPAKPWTKTDLAEDPFAALMQAIAERRDAGAFAQLFRHFAPRLKSYCMRGGADPAIAEEIAQDAMVAVWRRAATFDPARASVSTWIFTIARNRRIDLLRRERRPDPDPEDPSFAAESPPTPAQAYAGAEAQQQVRQRLAELPKEQATVLRMAFLDDKPHGRIADELALPLGTVKSRIRLGISRLRTMMANEELI